MNALILMSRVSECRRQLFGWGEAAHPPSDEDRDDDYHEDAIINLRLAILEVDKRRHRGDLQVRNFIDVDGEEDNVLPTEGHLDLVQPVDDLLRNLVQVLVWWTKAL